MAEKKVICDSDVIIDYWNLKSKRFDSTQALIEKNIGLSNVTITAITKMELLIGAVSKTDLTKINENLGRFSLIILNEQITVQALELIQKYTLSHGLLLPDALIAASAICSGLPLCTYNIKDYKFIPGLILFT